MAEWYGELAVATKAHIHAAGFAQCHAERWWDTTHAFHITESEKTVTPRDFHHTTGLRCDSATINLEGESGFQLAIDLLGRRYSLDMNCYFDLEGNYWPFLRR